MAEIAGLEALSIREPELAREFAGAFNLDQAFRIMERNGFELAKTEVIAQDEFSHDLFVPLPEKSGWLVLGST